MPGDVASPRVATRSYAVTKGNADAAVAAVILDLKMKPTSRVKLETLESYEKLDGRDVRIALVESRMNSRKAIGFVMYVHSPGSKNASIRIFEVPAKTYADWGGVAFALYEAVLDKFYVANSLATLMTQAQTLSMMQELNYDLLFGNDITPALGVTSFRLDRSLQRPRHDGRVNIAAA